MDLSQFTDHELTSLKIQKSLTYLVGTQVDPNVSALKENLSGAAIFAQGGSFLVATLDCQADRMPRPIGLGALPSGYLDTRSHELLQMTNARYKPLPGSQIHDLGVREALLDHRLNPKNRTAAESYWHNLIEFTKIKTTAVASILKGLKSVLK